MICYFVLWAQIPASTVVELKGTTVFTDTSDDVFKFGLVFLDLLDSIDELLLGPILDTSEVEHLHIARAKKLKHRSSSIANRMYETREIRTQLQCI